MIREFVGALPCDLPGTGSAPGTMLTYAAIIVAAGAALLVVRRRSTAIAAVLLLAVVVVGSTPESADAAPCVAPTTTAAATGSATTTTTVDPNAGSGAGLPTTTTTTVAATTTTAAAATTTTTDAPATTIAPTTTAAPTTTIAATTTTVAAGQISGLYRRQGSAAVPNSGCGDVSTPQECPAPNPDNGPVSGATVYLTFAGTDNTLGTGDDVVMPTDTTDAGGNFSFTISQFGLYLVYITDLPADNSSAYTYQDGCATANVGPWSISTPSGAVFTSEVASMDSIVTPDFVATNEFFVTGGCD